MGFIGSIVKSHVSARDCAVTQKTLGMTRIKELVEQRVLINLPPAAREQRGRPPPQGRE